MKQTRLFDWLFLILSCVFSVGLFGQGKGDAKSQAILTKVTSLYKSYATIKASFSITTTSSNGKSLVENGTIWLKSKKFKLDYASQEIFCNGVYTWTYSKEDMELTKEDVKIRKNSISPAEIFSLYKKDFKSKYDGPIVRNNKNYDVILLTPSKKVNYAYVKLEIDKTSKKIQRVIQYFKNGTEIAIEIVNFIPNPPLEDAFFSWNQSVHKDVVLVDLTKKK
ncbi:MAG: outer membrane lipoprotein carrier protein LolA [Flavobacteriaceae bacterium]|nr:outer membrane lipoprotein carrier protein LolA [Flavobacteriaceae bacterium]